MEHPRTEPRGYESAPVPPGAYAPPEAPGTQRYVLAGWWRRAVAQIVDGVVVGAGALIVLAIFGAVFSIGFVGGDTAGTVSVVLGILFGIVVVVVLALLYAPVLMVRTNGQTLGKMATDCRVVRVDGSPVDFSWAAMREVVVKGLLLGVAASLTAGIAYLVDYLWPLWDDENRALHDMIVKSRVVRA